MSEYTFPEIEVELAQDADTGARLASAERRIASLEDQVELLARMLSGHIESAGHSWGWAGYPSSHERV